MSGLASGFGAAAGGAVGIVYAKGAFGTRPLSQRAATGTVAAGVVLGGLAAGAATCVGAPATVGGVLGAGIGFLAAKGVFGKAAVGLAPATWLTFAGGVLGAMVGGSVGDPCPAAPQVPAAPPPPAQVPPAPAPAPPAVKPTLTGLAITPGAATLNIGQSQQFKAFALYSDGSQVDVTSQALWSGSSPQGAISVGGTSGYQGVVTAQTGGVGTVVASFQGIAGQANVTVTQLT